MDSSQNDWSGNIADAIKNANRNIERIKHKRDYDDNLKETTFGHSGEVYCFDKNCPIYNSEETKVITTTVFHNHKAKENKMKQNEWK